MEHYTEKLVYDLGVVKKMDPDVLETVCNFFSAEDALDLAVIMSILW